MKKRAKTLKKSKSRHPLKSADVPATRDMLYEVRDEISSRMNRMEIKMDRKFASADFKSCQIETKMDAGFSRMEKMFKELGEEVRAQVHRIALVVEEQNARNKYVLDGYAQLYERQDKVDETFRKIMVRFPDP